MGVMGALFLISFAAIFVLHRQKKKQPLRKISPNLMIVSVVGNFLCIVNICFCIIFFELFVQKQSNCKSSCSVEERTCIKCWLLKNQNFVHFINLNGTMILCLSEFMVVIPYFLRSLRIKKMFDAREIYWQTDKMPKEMIKRWREKRIMIIFLGTLLFFATIYIILDYDSKILPNYNVMSTIAEAWQDIQ